MDSICASVDKMVLYKIGRPLEDFKCMVSAFGKNAKKSKSSKAKVTTFTGLGWQNCFMAEWRHWRSSNGKRFTIK